MTVQVIFSMLLDPATYRWKTLRKSVQGIRQSSFLSPAVWHQLRDYNRPDFHPDDRDTTALVNKWREELFGEYGSLNDKLITAA
jgi:predicted metal-dependent hydrolase